MADTLAVCNRQFVLFPSRKGPAYRPVCPQCGKPMHIYMREKYAVRFRCSDYPVCRTYLKTRKKGKQINLEDAGKKGFLISPAYDLYAFLEQIKGKEYADVVYLANQEATEAERRLLRPYEVVKARQEGCERYVHLLKDFIYYIRYGIKPAGISPTQFQMFKPVYEDISRDSRMLH